MLLAATLYFKNEKKISTQLVTNNLLKQSEYIARLFDNQLHNHQQNTQVLGSLFEELLSSEHNLSIEQSWQIVLPLISNNVVISFMTNGLDVRHSAPVNWQISNDIRRKQKEFIDQISADEPSLEQGTWSSLFFEPLVKQWLSFYMSPIAVDGKSVGIFASAINVDNVINELRNKLKESQNGSEIFIYDASGNLVFHPDYGSRLIRQNDNLHLLQRTNSIVRSSIVDFINLDKQSGEIYQFTDWGNKVFAVVQEIPLNDWTVVSYVPEKVMLQHANQQLMKMLSIIAILLTILFFMTIWLTRRYVSIRLRQTANLITRASNGHLDLRQHINGEDEIAQVNDKLNHLFDRFSSRLEGKRIAIEQLKLEVEENRALAQAVSYSDNAVLILELDFTIGFVDSKSLKLLNCDRDIVLGSRFFSHIHNLMAFIPEQIVNDIRRKQSWHGELVLKEFGSENQVWVNTTITPMRDDNGHVTKYVVSLQDISFIKDSQSKIEKLAYTDELTNLANRSFFVAQLEKFVEMNKRGHFNFALLHFDIDDFKRVNDKYGYEGGDSILTQLGQRLTERLRREDVVARMGGDEFALIIGMGDSEQSILNTATTILNLVAEPFKIKDQSVQINTSIGITLSNDDVKDAEILLQHADLAMFEAKNNGKNTFNFFTQELNDTVKERLDIELALTKALSQDKLELYYQPKVDFHKQQLVGYEALLRWMDDDLGFVSPAKFIPIAEQSHLILEISDWVMENAIKFVSSLDNKVPVSINISARQFESGTCSETIELLIKKYNVDPNLVELEITESYLMADVEDAILQLHEMKQIGVQISIDDFGTGYSSLSYLKRFPVNTLKIDRSFIQDIPHDVNDVEITGAIIAMAKKLGLEVIAEGAETKEQIDFLQLNECYLVQGYFYSKPLPEHAARQWQFTNSK